MDRPFPGAAFFRLCSLSHASAGDCRGRIRLDHRLNPEAAPPSPQWIRAANLARLESSPDDLRAAVSLNPRLSSAWIQLGLNAEADGNLPEAETDLLRAASVDHLYVPAWTLANFYFRRGDAAEILALGKTGRRSHL